MKTDRRIVIVVLLLAALAFAVTVALAFASTASAAANYSTKELGNFGKPETTAPADMNDKGQIVGSTENYGFVYDEVNGARLIHDLIDPGAGMKCHEGSLINNEGEIVGMFRPAIGDDPPYFLTPQAGALPEPCTLLLLLAGIVGLRRRHLAALE